MDNKIMNYLEELVQRYPVLESSKNDIIKAYEVIEESYQNGGKLLIAGNGGSASDAEHIVGELMKSFVLPRKLDKEYAVRLIEVDAVMGATSADLSLLVSDA